MFEISSKILRNQMNLPDTITEEVLVEVTEGGWVIKEGDQSMVALVDMSIPQEMFSEYEPEEMEEFTINISPFLDFVNQFDNKVKIEVKEAEVVLSDDVKKFTQPILSSGRGELPNIENLEFIGEIEIEPSELREVVKEADMVGDSILFEERDDELWATADTDTANFERKIGEIEKIDEEGEIRSRYPIDYLKKYTGAIDSDKIEIKLGNDYPMKSVGENSVFILAPRVEE